MTSYFKKLTQNLEILRIKCFLRGFFFFFFFFFYLLKCINRYGLLAYKITHLHYFTETGTMQT